MEAYRDDGVVDCTGFEEGQWIFCCSETVHVWDIQESLDTSLVFFSARCISYISFYYISCHPISISSVSQLQKLTIHLGEPPLHNL